MTRTYRKWASMKARCLNPTHPAFKYYGGRGVKVCELWQRSFEAFLEELGEAPPGLWLDRKDNSKGYEPGNCRWVTPTESARNRKQRQPDPLSLRSKAKRAGLPYIRVFQRIQGGWTEEQALTIPLQPAGGMTHAIKRELGLL